MDLEQIIEIVKSANLRKIAKGLKSAGCINCTRHPTLRKLSYVDIAKAACEETPYFPDGKGNEFISTLSRGVKGQENLVFISVEQLSPIRGDRENLFTKKILIYAYDCSADDEKFEAVARRVLEKHKKAFEKLAE